MKKLLNNKFLSLILVIVLLTSLTVSVYSKTTTIEWATIGGFYTDWMNKVAQKYTEQTGVKIDIVQIDNAVMYEKQGIEMASHTGVYDLVTNESMWRAEWAYAGFIVPLDDMIAKYGMLEDMKNFDPFTLKLSGMWNGKIYSLPYYTYNQGMFIREDLFNNTIEKVAFKEKYGEELRKPDNWDYFYKVAEFFTRKKGETLKGKVLEKPFFGVGLMAGRYPEIQDEFMAMLWGNGGDVMDGNFNAVVNSNIGVATMEYYTKLLDNCAPPGARSSSYDGVIAQLNDNIIAMTGPMFLDQWANAVKTEDIVPGARVKAIDTPLKKGYVGAFGISITADSRQKEEAFKFLQFLMSKEIQKDFALGGGSTIRLDVLTDPEVISPANRKKTGGFPTLVEMMKLQKDADYTIFDSPAAGKIYEEMMIHCNMAANHEVSCKKAMDLLAEKIDELNKPYKNIIDKLKR